MHTSFYLRPDAHSDIIIDRILFWSLIEIIHQIIIVRKLIQCLIISFAQKWGGCRICYALNKFLIIFFQIFANQKETLALLLPEANRHLVTSLNHLQFLPK